MSDRAVPPRPWRAATDDDPASARAARAPAGASVLAAIQVFFGVVLGLFALFPPLPVTPRTFFAVAAVGCLALATFTFLAVPHLPLWWLGASAAATGVVIASASLFVSTPQGQVGAGLALVLPGVFAAQYVSRWTLGLLLAAMLGAWLIALAINPILPGAPVWVVGIVGVVVGVSWLVFRLESRLRFQAEHDALTGALNRHGLERRSRIVRGVAVRSGAPMSVVLIDLDDFKALNDAHGHLAGDDLLRDLVAGWWPSLRAGDLLARFGGDEFALVLPGSTPEEAESLLTRLHAAVPGDWTSGVSSWGLEESVYEALANADRALYQAKRDRGRRAGAAGQTTP